MNTAKGKEINTEAKEEEHSKKLRYSEDLKKVETTLRKYYTEKDIYVFRTSISNPPAEIDSIPQKFRNKGDKERTYEYEPTAEELSMLDEKDQLSFIGARGLSVYKSEEKLKKESIRTYKGIKKKYGEDEAKAYAEKSRGIYIQKLHITPDVGLLGKFSSSGHANLLLYEGFTINDLRDDGYETKTIKYEEDDTKQ